MALVDFEPVEAAIAEARDRGDADVPEIDHQSIALQILPGGRERAAAQRKRMTSRQLARVRHLLWHAVVAIMHAEEPVLVYGPNGKAKLVRRRDAERLHAERVINEATSVEDARAKLGFPTVGFDAPPDLASAFDGIDRGVVQMPPRHAASTMTLETMADAAAAMKEGKQIATWTCEVCRDVHDVNHAGLMLFACGGMLCCSCERRWPEHQAKCVPCAELAATLTKTVDDGAPLFDLSDTPEE